MAVSSATFPSWPTSGATSSVNEFHGTNANLLTPSYLQRDAQVGRHLGWSNSNLSILCSLHYGISKHTSERGFFWGVSVVWQLFRTCPDGCICIGVQAAAEGSKGQKGRKLVHLCGHRRRGPSQNSSTNTVLICQKRMEITEWKCSTSGLWFHRPCWEEKLYITIARTSENTPSISRRERKSLGVGA